jgi:hypothetical protein
MNLTLAGDGPKASQAKGEHPESAGGTQECFPYASGGKSGMAPTLIAKKQAQVKAARKWDCPWSVPACV